MNKIVTLIRTSCLSLFLFSIACLVWNKNVMTACASDGEEYITIRVQASDDNGDLQYALDSDEASAFTSSNEFKIPAGTSHTIYVKDMAGNITSQTYNPPGSISDSIQDSNDEEGQKINIDLELGNDEDFSDYDYLTDLPVEPAEPGTGTVYDKLNTDGSDSAEKIFYTVTTEEGDVFYLVIDQRQDSDNVYLLNTVTRSDLEALAVDNDKTESDDKEKNLLEVLSSENDTTNTTTTAADKISEDSNSRASSIVVVLLIAAAGGVYYYLKVYKNKKNEMMDAMDAMDMEEFVPETEEEEEINFDVNDEEKQKALDELFESDDAEELGNIEEYSDLPEDYGLEEEFEEESGGFGFDEEEDDLG